MAICVHMVQGLSVHFKNPKPFYVVLGRELVLETNIQKIAAEKVSMVTWECNTDSGARTLATYPGKTQDSRIRMEREGAILRISDVRASDFGRYTITVTDQDGTKTYKEKHVKQSEKPPDASVLLLCGVSGERASWDSPMVKWLVDGVELTNEMANISDGGSKLLLQEVKGPNYTCIRDCSQGTSVAYFIIADPTKYNLAPCCIGLIVIGVAMLIVLVGIFWF